MLYVIYILFVVIYLVLKLEEKNTYDHGYNNSSPKLWKDKYNLICSLFAKNQSLKACASGSENGSGPAKVSEHGLDEAPPNIQ